MTPVKFDGVNVVYAENQPEYFPLPGYRKPNGEFTTCWKLTWRERLRVLFHGRFWLNVLTFNNPLQPLCPGTQRKDVSGE